MEEKQQPSKNIRSGEILSFEQLSNGNEKPTNANMTNDGSKEQIIESNAQKFYGRFIGIGLIILGYSMAAGATVITKWTYVHYQNLHPSNINFARSFGVIFWSAVISVVCRVNPFVVPRAGLSMLAFKAVGFALTTVSYYYIISQLDIFIASQLYSTMAIFLIIFSHLIGKSRMTVGDFMICLGGFFGVFCIQATNFYTSSESASLIDILSNNIKVVLMFACLLIAMAQAINIMVSRELNRYVHVSVSTTYTGFAFAIIMCIRYNGSGSNRCVAMGLFIHFMFSDNLYVLDILFHDR